MLSALALVALVFISATQAVAQNATGVETDAYREYRDQIHPNMVRNCAECHSRDSSTRQSPRHSDRDPAFAFPLFLRTLNLANPESSKLFARVRSMHYCLEWGENCDVQDEIESDVVGRVRSWMENHRGALAVSEALTQGSGAVVSIVATEADSFGGDFPVMGAAPDAPWIHASFRKLIGNTYQMSSLELRGSNGTWRVTNGRVLIDGHTAPGTGLEELNRIATLRLLDGGSIGFARHRLIAEKPLLTLRPGQSVTVAADVETVASDTAPESNRCINEILFEAFVLPLVRSDPLGGASWLGATSEELGLALENPATRSGVVASLCDAWHQRLHATSGRSPLLADADSERRALLVTIASRLSRTIEWSPALARAPRISFQSLSRSYFSTLNLDFGCGLSIEGAAYCWGGRFGSTAPASALSVADSQSTFSTAYAPFRPLTNVATSQRMNFPRELSSIALSDLGLVCGVDRAEHRVRCGGHVFAKLPRPAPPPQNGRARQSQATPPQRWGIGPASGSYRDSVEMEFWNKLLPDYPLELQAVGAVFCGRMNSGRVICHGPDDLGLRGLGAAVKLTDFPSMATSAGARATMGALYRADQVAHAVPIRERVDRLFATPLGFCAAADQTNKLYCWGQFSSPLQTASDIDLLRSDRFRLSGPPGGPVRGWTDSRRPQDPPRFLSGQTFPKPILKLAVSWVSGGSRFIGTLVAKDGTLYRFNSVDGVGLENLTMVENMPFVVDAGIGVSGYVCVLDRDGGFGCLNDSGLPSPLRERIRQAEDSRVRYAAFQTPQLALSFSRIPVDAHVRSPDCLLGQDGQMRCLGRDAERDGNFLINVAELRMLPGLARANPDLAYLVPFYRSLP